MTVGSAPACARNGRSGSGVGGRFELVLALPLSACWMKDTIGRRPLPDVSQNIVIEPRKTCGRRERGNMGEGGGTYVGLPGEQADGAALPAVHRGEHDDVHAGHAQDDARGDDGAAGDVAELLAVELCAGERPDEQAGEEDADAPVVGCG